MKLVSSQRYKLTCAPLEDSDQPACADPERFVIRAPTVITFIRLLFFLIDEDREDQTPLKAGHHRPTSETPS